MLSKIKTLPHKTSFIIGITLVLAGCALPFNIFTRIVGGIVVISSISLG